MLAVKDLYAYTSRAATQRTAAGRRSLRGILLALCLGGATTGGAPAQEPASGPAERWKRTHGLAVETRAQRFAEAAPRTAEGTHSLAGKAIFFTSATQGPHQWRLEGALAYGSQDKTYAGYGLGLDAGRRRLLALNELYWNTGWGDIDFFAGLMRDDSTDFGSTAGPWGTGRRLGPLDRSDPTRPQPLGRWRAGFDFYHGDTSLGLAVLPFFRPHRGPVPASRWAAGEDFYFYGRGLDVLGQRRPDGLGQVQVDAFYRWTRGPWHMDLRLFWGPSADPLLWRRADGQRLRRYGRVTVIDLSGWTARADFELFWQGQARYGGRLDDDVLAATAGLRRGVGIPGFFERLEGTLAGSVQGSRRPSKPQVLAGSTATRADGDGLWGGLALQRGTGWELAARGHWLADQGRLWRVAAVRRHKGLSVALYGDFFDGPEGGYYGRWQDNGRWLVEMGWVW